jgi:hypothetical protein
VIAYYSQNASGNAEDVKAITVFKDDAPPTTRGAQPLPGGTGRATPDSVVEVAEEPVTPPPPVEIAVPVEEEIPVQTASQDTSS